MPCDRQKPSNSPRWYRPLAALAEANWTGGPPDGRVSILRSAVLPTTDAPAGEGHQMSQAADISEPASELERLIAALSGSGLLVFVFGVGWWTAHLTGATVPVFRGPTGAGGTPNSATARRAGLWTCGSMRSPGSGSCAGPTRSRPFLGGRS